MTFSIIGRCETSGKIGIAISSSSIAVGARCPWLRAGVGAVSTQNITLPAALNEGGEAGPVHSAALSIIDGSSPSINCPIVDLRVDWADHDPIGELIGLWQAYQPQMDDYIARALEPANAPSYGVPGDE